MKSGSSHEWRLCEPCAPPKAPALERLLDLLAEELVERYLIEVGMKETATHDDRD